MNRLIVGDVCRKLHKQRRCYHRLRLGFNYKAMNGYYTNHGLIIEGMIIEATETEKCSELIVA